MDYYSIDTEPMTDEEKENDKNEFEKYRKIFKNYPHLSKDLNQGERKELLKKLK